MWRKHHQSTNPSGPEGTVQGSRGSAMASGVCNWYEIGSLSSLDSNMTSQRYVNIFSDHQIISVDNYSGKMRHPTGLQHLSSGLRSTLLDFVPSLRHINTQTWPLSRISEMFCNVLFLGDLHYFHSRGFADCPARIIVGTIYWTSSKFSWIHATPCCGTSACSWGLYTILDWCTSFYLTIQWSILIRQDQDSL